MFQFDVSISMSYRISLVRHNDHNDEESNNVSSRICPLFKRSVVVGSFSEISRVFEPETKGVRSLMSSLYETPKIGTTIEEKKKNSKDTRSNIGGRLNLVVRK